MNSKEMQEGEKRQETYGKLEKHKFNLHAIYSTLCNIFITITAQLKMPINSPYICTYMYIE